MPFGSYAAQAVVPIKQGFGLVRAKAKILLLQVMVTGDHSPAFGSVIYTLKRRSTAYRFIFTLQTAQAQGGGHAHTLRATTPGGSNAYGAPAAVAMHSCLHLSHPAQQISRELRCAKLLCSHPSSGQHSAADPAVLHIAVVIHHAPPGMLANKSSH